MTKHPLPTRLSLALWTAIRTALFSLHGERTVDLNKLLAEAADVERLYLAGPACARANDVTQTDIRRMVGRGSS